MNPGELDRRVTIQTPSVSVSANGEESTTYSTYGDRWAKMETISIDEDYGSDGRIVVNSRVRFTIRFERINENYRLRYQNKTYEISGITETERRRYLELDCYSTEQTNFRT